MKTAGQSSDAKYTGAAQPARGNNVLEAGTFRSTGQLIERGDAPWKIVTSLSYKTK